MSKIVAIRGHPDYKISSDGYAINKLGDIMSTKLDKDGYHILRTCDNGKVSQLKLHRIVAIHFIPNPSNLPQVNHKDGDKNNNSVENLQWSTPSNNTQHSYDTGLHKVKRVVRHGYNGKKDVFDNAIKAAESIGVRPHNIRVAISRGTMSGGYYWTHE